jgi:hypothetical protein
MPIMDEDDYVNGYRYVRGDYGWSFIVRRRTIRERWLSWPWCPWIGEVVVDPREIRDKFPAG